MMALLKLCVRVGILTTCSVGYGQHLNHSFLPELQFLAQPAKQEFITSVSRHVKQTPTVRAARTNGMQLLFFHASWCGPCKRMDPFMRTMSGVVDVDVDRRPDLKTRYGVTSIPVVVALRGGSEVGRFVGYASQETIRSWLSTLGTPRVNQQPAERIITVPAQVAPSPIHLDRQFSGVWLGSG